MITRQTVETLIDRYDDVVKLAKSFGYVNLRLYYGHGDNEDNMLHFVGTYRTDDSRASDSWKRDINVEFQAILGVEVSFLGEKAPAIQPVDLEEAENAPLSDMHKVIDYFSNTLIPYSFGVEKGLDPQECRALHEQWEQRKMNMTSALRSHSLIKADKSLARENEEQDIKSKADDSASPKISDHS